MEAIMKKFINKFMAMAIATVMSVMAFTIPSQAKTLNGFEGNWNTKYDGGSCEMTIWNDETMTFVFSDEPNVGYIYNYVIDEKGLLIAYTDEHEYITSIGMYNSNILMDSDGNTWVRSLYQAAKMIKEI